MQTNEVGRSGYDFHAGSSEPEFNELTYIYNEM